MVRGYRECSPATAAVAPGRRGGPASDAGLPIRRTRFSDVWRTAAKAAETRAQKGEVKELARTIIADQQREIEQMMVWRQAWYGSGSTILSLPM